MRGSSFGLGSAYGSGGLAELPTFKLALPAMHIHMGHASVSPAPCSREAAAAAAVAAPGARLDTASPPSSCARAVGKVTLAGAKEETSAVLTPGTPDSAIGGALASTTASRSDSPSGSSSSSADTSTSSSSQASVACAEAQAQAARAAAPGAPPLGQVSARASSADDDAAEAGGLDPQRRPQRKLSCLRQPGSSRRLLAGGGVSWCDAQQGSQLTTVLEFTPDKYEYIDDDDIDPLYANCECACAIM